MIISSLIPLNPRQCTKTIALVFLVIALLIFSAVIAKLSKDTSTNTGVIPNCTTDEISDTHPNGGTITSPIPLSSLTIAIETKFPELPEFNIVLCLTPNQLVHIFSNSLTFSPFVNLWFDNIKSDKTSLSSRLTLSFISGQLYVFPIILKIKFNPLKSKTCPILILVKELVF